eukprot:TRINITY_DN5704_c0_g2_i1.p1 TRINITY_DN5704_c0_g2~~TRINITY_DN5704_c0_g2_i1.p1  ORF type:complete len:136 (+),score=26.62 TRINITY_DN5704_c0_g2_i1:487-894(+)
MPAARRSPLAGSSMSVNMLTHSISQPMKVGVDVAEPTFAPQHRPQASSSTMPMPLKVATDGRGLWADDKTTTAYLPMPSEVEALTSPPPPPSTDSLGEVLSALEKAILTTVIYMDAVRDHASASAAAPPRSSMPW